MFRVALLQFCGQILWQIGQAAAQQRFHDDGGNAALLQFGIQIRGVGVAAVDFVGIVPVQVVQLYLHKVPVVLVVPRQQGVKHGDVAVIRESQVADAACLALLYQIVQHAVFHVARFEGRHAASADGV